MNAVRLPRAALCLLLLALVPATARAQTQQNFDVGLYDTRESLQAKLNQYEVANPDAYSAALRAIANYDKDLIQERLVEGDFQVGDKITIEVTGHQDLSSTFTVTTGRVLILPMGIGEVPLRGVLRSELRDHLLTEIKRIVKNPQLVSVNTTIGITVRGDGVSSIGFQDREADARCVDVLQEAGLTPNAELEKMKIVRSGQEVWEGDGLYEACYSQRRTLDQLNLRAGDQINVPASSGGGFNAMTVLRTLPYVITLGFAISRIL